MPTCFWLNNGLENLTNAHRNHVGCSQITYSLHRVYSWALSPALQWSLTIILESVRRPEYHIQEIAGCLSEVLIDCDLRNAHTDKSNTTIIQYFFSKIKPLAFYQKKYFISPVPPFKHATEVALRVGCQKVKEYNFLINCHTQDPSYVQFWQLTPPPSISSYC